MSIVIVPRYGSVEIALGVRHPIRICIHLTSNLGRREPTQNTAFYLWPRLQFDDITSSIRIYISWWNADVGCIFQLYPVYLKINISKVTRYNWLKIHRFYSIVLCGRLIFIARPTCIPNGSLFCPLQGVGAKFSTEN